MAERRRDARVPLDVPLTFYAKGQSRERRGVARNISVGGMLVETATAPPFGAEVDLYVPLPGGSGRSRLPGIVRWARDGCIGVQFLPLGAMETHLITQLAERHGAKK